MFYKKIIPAKFLKSNTEKKKNFLETFLFSRKQTLYFAELLQKKYPRLPFAKRLKECCNAAWIERDYDKNHNRVGNERLIGMRCMHKFCSYCALVKSKKLIKFFYQNFTLEEVSKKNLAFLTITLPKHKVYEVKELSKKMNKGWGRFILYKDIKKIVKGYIKHPETTRGDSLDYDQAHYHQHILLELPKNYGKSDDYLHQKQWLALIRKAFRMPIKIIDIRKVDNVSGDIREILKYPLKLQDFKKKEGETDDHFAKWLFNLERQLKGARNISCGGTFKGAVKEPEEIDDEILNEKVEEEVAYTTYQKVITTGKGQIFIGQEEDEPPPDVEKYLNEKKERYRKKTIEIL
jgi:hypothetical protein